MPRAVTYPRYRISQWIDTSPEAMEKESATIRYGVQIQVKKGDKWLHCGTRTGFLIYDTASEAHAKMLELSSKEPTDAR